MSEQKFKFKKNNNNKYCHLSPWSKVKIKLSTEDCKNIWGKNRKVCLIFDLIWILKVHFVIYSIINKIQYKMYKKQTKGENKQKEKTNKNESTTTTFFCNFSFNLNKWDITWKSKAQFKQTVFKMFTKLQGFLALAITTTDKFLSFFFLFFLTGVHVLYTCFIISHY